MKKIIRLFLILVILFIPIWILIDGIIVKSMIIKTSEKMLKKKTFLKEVKINYIPNLSIELIEFKLPNPTEDNFIINSKSVRVNLNLIGLLKKSLIIDEISSKETVLFDTSMPTSKIIKPSIQKAAVKNKSEGSVKTIISDTFKSSLNIFNDSEIKSNVQEKFDFTEETNKIDEIIAISTEKIKAKKTNVLKQTTDVLYELNTINLDGVNDINQFNTTLKSLERINIKYNEISDEISSVEDIYKQSKKDINIINDQISQKVSSSLTFEAINNQLSPSGYSLSEPSRKIVEKIIQNFKNKSKKSDDPQIEIKKFTGKTYVFNTKKSPRFLIKFLELSSPNEKHYVKGANLSLSPAVKDELKIYVKIKDQALFQTAIIDLKSKDKEKFQANVKIKNLKIQKTKLFENDEIVVNFMENKSTNIDVTGVVSKTSNLVLKTVIQQPNYRVINKKTTTNLISEFIPYLDNKDLLFTMRFNGSLDNFVVDASSNLDPLIEDVQKTLLPRKMAHLKNEVEKIKKIELQKTTNKKKAFNKSYTTILNQLKFQESEILNQKNLIQDKLESKKSEFTNVLKSLF